MKRIINYVLSLLAFLFLELSFDNNESKHFWHDTTTTTAIGTLVYRTLSSLLQTHNLSLSLSLSRTHSFFFTLVSFQREAQTRTERCTTIQREQVGIAARVLFGATRSLKATTRTFPSMVQA